jgi:hypothetical protein
MLRSENRSKSTSLAKGLEPSMSSMCRAFSVGTKHELDVSRKRLGVEVSQRVGRGGVSLERH